ncbi:MAG: hypothetical protein IPK64_10125 [bacterium]|nr:hypothetical protein [bacterium]
MMRCNGIHGAALAALFLVWCAAGSALAVGGSTPADDPATGRAAWLLERAALQDLPLTGLKASPDEFGGGAASGEPMHVAFEGDDRRGAALPVLASLVLPGAGEAMLGYTRGYLMMALDIFAWTRVAAKHSDGVDLRDEYYAYADAHYSDERLLEAFVTNSSDIERDGVGDHYFSDVGAMIDLSDLDQLPLYVTVEADRREYYENLGKWDQFVFGWDDFVNPLYRDGYTPTNVARIDLGQPWVSEHREIYRLMRDESNDAFKSRDRWLYLNIGLRLASVVQTAWLGGLLGGDGDGFGGGEGRLSLGGHEVRLIARPHGLRRATLAAAVSF